jgi:hypothetical protein
MTVSPVDVAVGGPLVLEALGRLLVGLPVHAPDAGRALQLHVAVRTVVILSCHKSESFISK